MVLPIAHRQCNLVMGGRDLRNTYVVALDGRRRPKDHASATIDPPHDGDLFFKTVRQTSQSSLHRCQGCYSTDNLVPRHAEEIRNEIYTQASQLDEHLRIDEDDPSKLDSAFPFSVLNRQALAEYISLLDIQTQAAQHIHLAVRDFDFSHILPFYDNFFSTQIKPLERKIEPFGENARTLTIHFEFGPDYSAKPTELIVQKCGDNGVEFTRTYALGPKTRAERRGYERWLRRWQGGIRKGLRTRRC